MFLTHAPPPRFLSTLAHNRSRASPYTHTATLLFSLPTILSVAKSLFWHSRRRSLVTMNGENPDAGDSLTEHVSGDWYSVPEIRLRDHRFTVPLDYSRGVHSFPKISVFAREVVAGNSGHSELIQSFFFFYGFDCICCLFIALGFLVAWMFCDYTTLFFGVCVYFLC